MTYVTDAGLPQGDGVLSNDASAPPAQSKGRWQDHKPLDPRSFPHGERRSGILPCTLPNVEHLLRSYDITVRYNVIRKRTMIDLPGWQGALDNADNVAMSTIVSLAEANTMQRGGIEEQVLAVANRNTFNPAADWIESKPWDGVDRLHGFYDTLVTAEGYPIELRNILIYKWLLSVVAAATKSSGFKARGVLTLQGPQGIGKTAWVASLVPDPVLRDRIVKLDHHLDPHDKDSVLGAITSLIVEIGELDSSFRNDIARLKGFITRDSDSIRQPYARTASEFARRTVFAATVNASDFLQDETGNTRFWTIPVIRIDYDHGTEMQKLFAQLRVDLDNGAQWWLTKEEEALLNDSNRNHLATSAIREGIMELVDLDRLHADDGQLMTTSDVLRKLGIDHPRNGQNKEAAAILRDLLGEPKKIRGNLKWRVPLAQEPEGRRFGNLP
jgi:predicted P-loop ATPase